MVITRHRAARRTAFALSLAATLLGPARPQPAQAQDAPQPTQAQDAPQPTQAQDAPPRTQAELVRSVIATVVNITARAEAPPDAFGAETGAGHTTQANQVRVSAGSGFLVDPSGLIMTNWHVVVGAYEVLVTFSDGTHALADVTHADRVLDLAVLKVDVGHKLPAISWGDSAKVQVGDPVIAIGNALGVGMSVSAGIVSALNRNISDTPVDDFIQTDAAINHGNSGGPLFNDKGEVIGLNSAIISPTAASAGLGFAMPSNDVQFAFHELVHTADYPRPGWLGVKIQAMTLDMADALGQTEPRGSLVAAVLPGGPAQRAGLQAGDLILRFNNETPSDERALLRAITKTRPGTPVALGVWRYGRQLELTATLEGWPKMMWEKNDATPQKAMHLAVLPDLGLTVVPLTDALRTANQIDAQAAGALVSAVAPASDAERRGIAIGDVVMQIGATPVRTAQDVQREIDQARRENRHFALFLVLPKIQPVSNTQFPGPHWLALRIANG